MTDLRTPNRVVLESVAERLEALLPQIVFVGGQVAELLITDPGAVRVRPTEDVDVIVTASTKLEYAKIEGRMRALGFIHDIDENAPICRWISPDGHLLDLMPAEQDILGFANRWYPYAVGRSEYFELRHELRIRIPSPPAYLATKLEAFRDRGSADPLGSHDLEDVIVLVAGRPAVVEEVSRESAELRHWLQVTVRGLIEHPDFQYAIQGALPDAAQIPGYREEVQRRFAVLTE